MVFVSIPLCLRVLIFFLTRLHRKNQINTYIYTKLYWMLIKIVSYSTKISIKKYLILLSGEITCGVMWLKGESGNLLFIFFAHIFRIMKVDIEFLNSDTYMLLISNLSAYFDQGKNEIWKLQQFFLWSNAFSR